MSETATGYLSEEYVRSLDHLGDVVPLPASGGWVLATGVPGHDERDGRGPYPLFLCAHWDELADDLSALEGLVSVTMVVDPLAPVTPSDLMGTFDLVLPFKAHHLVDLTGGPPRPTRHHEREVRAANREVHVEITGGPAASGDDWVRLYRDLVGRRAVTGVADLPECSLRAQLEVPGCIAVRALRRGRCVSMALWYRHGDTAHLHLAASDAEGYETGAAYAVMAASVEHLARVAQVLDLGGVAGDVDDPSSGLARFKGGWATRTAKAHLCGKVTDREAFDRLTKRCVPPVTGYFPPYRAVSG